MDINDEVIHCNHASSNGVSVLDSKTQTLKIRVLNGAKEFLYFQVQLITSDVVWPVLYVFVI